MFPWVKLTIGKNSIFSEPCLCLVCNLTYLHTHTCQVYRFEGHKISYPASRRNCTRRQSKTGHCHWFGSVSVLHTMGHVLWRFRLVSESNVVTIRDYENRSPFVVHVRLPNRVVSNYIVEKIGRKRSRLSFPTLGKQPIAGRCHVRVFGKVCSHTWPHLSSHGGFLSSNTFPFRWHRGRKVFKRCTTRQDDLPFLPLVPVTIRFVVTSPDSLLSND